MVCNYLYFVNIYTPSQCVFPVSSPVLHNTMGWIGLLFGFQFEIKKLKNLSDLDDG